MRLLTTFTLAAIFLILTSCQKEDITPTTQDTTTTTTGTTTTDPDSTSTSTSTTGTTTTDPDSTSTTTTTTTNDFTVLEYIKSENDFSLFYEALSRTGLKAEIGGDGPYTIFIPDNQAFQEFLDTNNWNSFDDVSPNVLTLIVKFHISNSEVMIGNLTTGTLVPILFNSKELFINMDNTDAPFVVLGLTQADITESDMVQTNGVVHRINGVLSL